jgi:hypothetical protein
MGRNKRKCTCEEEEEDKKKGAHSMNPEAVTDVHKSKSRSLNVAANRYHLSFLHCPENFHRTQRTP